jgi:alpha-galactosidase
MTADYIPAEFPKDNIAASPAELAAVQTWTETVFGAGAATASESDFLIATVSPPFSFIYNGIPSSEFIGSWQRAAEKRDQGDRICYVTSYTDPATGLRVVAAATVFKEHSAVEWLLEIENTGATDTPIIENIRTADFKLLTNEAGIPIVLHQLHGDACNEMSFVPFDATLPAGASMVMTPARGRPSQETAFPFWNLQFGEQGLVMAIGWSGQWAAWFDRAPEGPTRFGAGIEKTRLLLHPGEKIRTPRLLLMTWHGERQLAQNRFRRLMLSKYVPQVEGKPLRLPVCLQTFDTYWQTDWWPTEAGQFEAVDVAQQLGCDAYWLDAAWFVGNFPNGVGNWFHKPVEFPNGLGPIGERCRAAGMDFIVWFEPCRVAQGSLIAREHPEFVLGGEAGGLYNLGDPAARRWITDLVSQRISEYGITVYREDYNIDPLDYWRNNDTPDRQGMTEIRFVEGHYAFWDELRAQHPGLWIDDCASGGRRIDLETCMRSVPLWRSDTSCWAGHPEWNQMQSMALSQFVPLNTACSWHADRYTVRSAATGGQIHQFAFRNADFDIKAAAAIVAETKENRKYWYGDMYPLTPVNVDLSQFFAYQLHRADLNAGLVMAFRRPDCPARGLIVELQAIDPKMRYEVEFIDGSGKKTIRELAGQDLISSGLELRITDKSDSMLVRYQVVSGDAN